MWMCPPKKLLKKSFLILYNVISMADKESEIFSCFDSIFKNIFIFSNVLNLSNDFVISKVISTPAWILQYTWRQKGWGKITGNNAGGLQPLLAYQYKTRGLFPFELMLMMKALAVCDGTFPPPSAYYYTAIKLWWRNPVISITFNRWRLWNS